MILEKDPRAKLTKHYTKNSSRTAKRQAMTESTTNEELLKAGVKLIYFACFSNSSIHTQRRIQVQEHGGFVLQKGRQQLAEELYTHLAVKLFYKLFSIVITNRLTRRLDEF